MIRGNVLKLLRVGFVATYVVFLGTIFQNCAPSMEMANREPSMERSLACADPSCSDLIVEPSSLNCEFNGFVVENGVGILAYKSSAATTCEFETRICTDGELSGRFEFPECDPVMGAKKLCLFDGKVVPHGKSVDAYSTSNGACEVQKRVCSDGILSGSFQFAKCKKEGPLSCLFGGKTIPHGATTKAYALMNPVGEDCRSENRLCSNGVLSGEFTHTSCARAMRSCAADRQTIDHGSSAVMYASASVPFGQKCQRQTRKCADGILSGSYGYGTCVEQKPLDCKIGDEVVAHGKTVKAYRVANVGFEGACEPETRVCTDGVLSGKFKHLACERAAVPSTIHLYMKGSGANGHAGTDPEKPLKNLNGVLRAITNTYGQFKKDIVVNIHPETYVDEDVQWTYASPDHRITFRPWTGMKGRPRFLRTSSTAKSFFSVLAVNNKRSNLHFYQLDIEGYHAGIKLNGLKDARAAFNSHNSVKECFFLKIGQLHVAGETEHAYSALGIANSRNNEISGNRFYHIENKPGVELGKIHAIYAAYSAHDNVIRNNFFVNVSGYPVKFRDGSNNNLVEGNLFWKTSNHPYGLVVSDNLNYGVECPNINVVMRNNYFGTNYFDQAGGEPGHIIHPDRNYDHCALKTPRLRGTGNIRVKHLSELQDLWNKK